MTHNVAVVTIDRPGRYLPGLITSIMNSDLACEKLIACVGNTDTGYLPFDTFDQVLTLPDAVRINHGNHIDSIINHANAVLNANIILEDDVIISKTFKKRLENAINACYTIRPSGHFILTLSTHNVWPSGSVVVPQPLETYVGTMATYVPKELQFDLFRFMISYLQSPDVTIAEYCRTKGIPLYCITESIAKHMGLQSAISERFIDVECPTFVED